jgi:hypothetical protein
MRSVSRIPSKTGGKVRLDDGKFGKFSVRLDFGTSLHSSQTCPRRSGLANNHEQTQSCLQSAFIWRMSVYVPYVKIQNPTTIWNDEDDVANANIPNIPPSLRACASPGFFYTANSPQDIENAMQDMFLQVLAAARLTQ